MAATDQTKSARIGLRELLIALAVIAVGALLWLNRRVLVLAFGAIVFATVIRAIAAPIERFTKLRGRWSVLLALLVLALVLGGVAWLFGLRIADQLAQLQEQVPRGIESVRQWARSLPHGDAIIATIKNGVASTDGGKFAEMAGTATAAVTNFLLIIFAAIYFALDPELYRSGVVRLVPPAHRPQVGRALVQAGDALARWVRAQLVLMVAVGLLTGIGLALIGVPLAFTLALIIGLFEFIPLIGPILGAAPGILLAFTQSPKAALYATLVYVAVQQLESNLLTPVVQRWAVALPPALALLAVLVGGLTFGLLGVIFATPLAVVAMVLVQHLYIEDGLEKR